MFRYIEACVAGGPCAHLKPDEYCITHFLKLIKDNLHVENFNTLTARMEIFYASSIKKEEDIFQYFSRLTKEIDNIHRLQYLTAALGESILIPKYMIILKILAAASLRKKEYGFFLERLIIEDTEEWLRKGPDELMSELARIKKGRDQLVPVNQPQGQLAAQVSQQNRRR